MWRTLSKNKPTFVDFWWFWQIFNFLPNLGFFETHLWGFTIVGKQTNSWKNICHKQVVHREIKLKFTTFLMKKNSARSKNYAFLRVFSLPPLNFFGGRSWKTNFIFFVQGKHICLWYRIIFFLLTVLQILIWAKKVVTLCQKMYFFLTKQHVLL